MPQCSSAVRPTNSLYLLLEEPIFYLENGGNYSLQNTGMYRPASHPTAILLIKTTPVAHFLAPNSALLKQMNVCKHTRTAVSMASQHFNLKCAHTSPLTLCLFPGL